MITSAAIKYNNLVCIGKNHADILFNLIRTVEPIFHQDKAVEGFIDDKANFLTRREAADHAFEAGQIKERKYELFSFDLEGK
jgi:hypothetical protein